LKILIFSMFIFATLSLTAVFGDESEKPSAHQLYVDSIEFLKNGEDEHAIELLEKAVEIDPDLAPAWNALGLVYMGRGGYEEDAINAFKRSLELLPDQPDAYANLGIIYASGEKDFVAAEDYLKKAIALQPDNIRAQFGMAWVLLWHKKDGKRAEDAFQVVLERNPQNVMAQYGLGMAYLAQENRAMALKSISTLRYLHRDDLAVNLESTMQPRAQNNSPETTFEPSGSDDFNLGSF